MKPTIGQTQYYSRNVNGETQYSAMPYAGNAPYDYTSLSKDQYIQGLQGQSAKAQQQMQQGLPAGYQGAVYDAGSVKNFNDQITAAQNGTGIHAAGYVDPQLSKFQANAPTPSAEYLKPEFKAQYDQSLAQYNQDKITAANNPALKTASTPEQQQADKYKQILQQLQGSGQKSPATQGAANAAITGATPPPPPPGPNTGLITQTLQNDQGFSDITKQVQQLLSPQGVQQTLAQDYQQMMAASGLPALNTQLMNMKQVMDGTEQDLRDEITRSGGLATNSQVLALTNARNSTLVKQYSALVDQQTNLKDQINTMIGLDEKDRVAAQAQASQSLQIGMQLMQMQQTMQRNAQDSMANNIKQFGAKAVYDAAVASGDPSAIQRINSMMGPGFDIKTMANQPVARDNQIVKLDNGQTVVVDKNTGKIVSNIGGAAGIGSTGVDGATGTTPTALQPYARTSFGGVSYADLSSLTPSEKSKYAQLAQQSGMIPILDAGTAGKLSALSVSKENLTKIGSAINGLLNNDSIGAIQGTGNSLKSFFGDDDIKAFNAWRTAVINNVQALAGGQGSGLRINQAEIDTAMKNDLPVITGFGADTLGQAQKKIANLNSQLDTWNKQILGGGNQAGQSTSVPKLLTPTDVPSGYYQASDGLLYKK